MEQDLFALPKTQMSVDWKYTFFSNLQDIDNLFKKCSFKYNVLLWLEHFSSFMNPMNPMVPNAAQTKLSLARRGIEPVTFALLARRSNQLS